MLYANVLQLMYNNFIDLMMTEYSRNMSSKDEHISKQRKDVVKSGVWKIDGASKKQKLKTVNSPGCYTTELMKIFCE
jgi:hypothetical protein